MKRWLVIAGLSVTLAACGGEEKSTVTTEAPKAQQSTEAKPAAQTVAATPQDKNALAEEAKAAVQALGGTLKGELQQAMKSGGPVNALSVCNTKAPEIASAVSAEKNLQVSRVSLKNRNPDMGKPNAWQIRVLEDFENRKAAGESPMTLAYSEIVDNGGQQEFRFMKAIPTDKLCLVCHGTDISPAIQAKLTELYPQDKATGYKEGDLRGAFVVVKSLN
ncbi:MAG: DUF3365 domain-containing protein [Thiolinea sp.]